jgi:hypothetical protein
VSDEIIFDNSALSRLVEETENDRKALLAGLRTLGVLHVTALNVVETAKTNDNELRLRKLAFYREVAGTVAPINSPAELLEYLIRAHHRGLPTIQTGDQQLYALLSQPSLAGDGLRDKFTIWARDEERRFSEMHAAMRERFDVSFEAGPDRFSSEAAFMDFALNTSQSTSVSSWVTSTRKSPDRCWSLTMCPDF